MVEFTNRTPTIAQVYNYTYRNKSTWTRFFNEERDILKTRIKITKRIVYHRNKENMQMTPYERLVIQSFSYPQYEPYLSVKSKNAIRQRKIRHQYDITLVMGVDKDGFYNFWTSPIRWHVGSFKKWENKPPQSKIKSIYVETRQKLERKYSKYPTAKRNELIRRDIEHIKKRATYLDVGDFNSRVKGLNGDFYFRVAPLQLKCDASYGKVYERELPRDVGNFVFFDKHMLGLIHYCLRRGIIKYK